ncbi:MAG: diguanylate cyclase [Candidatus Izemoplasmatales bacterium]|jgi:GGDEF domain-containing protein/PAS domain-containing protein|nr:diguanylate cyclase [Candidatus Izemoplasmatales bacterium]MDD4354947.1 diguanylate cyclase [Candidatus Izemoplasmatales bacterium]MDD4987433.1 diguanylate cyclase [Candidatus Izemoplasmatales bacterium]MDD5601375.1 diguanylate cyclase [Candidatus Izemoplasmatales bacterium]MDY0373536.1 diguanylate cyclase [Candidatus Izemoplasmatales bacterium]
MELFIYLGLGTMGLIYVLGAILYKKWLVWKLILLLLFIASALMLLVFSEQIGFLPVADILEYFPYAVFAGAVLFALTFRRKIRITQNLTDYDFFELEKELEETKSASELLRERYIATIGLVSEALIFYNEELSGLFVTDQFLAITNTKQNEWTLEQYVANIYEDDQTAYLSTVKKITKKSPGFDMKYRFKRGGTTVWLEEKGRVFEFDKKIHLISSIRAIDMKLFPETLIHEIDSLPTEQQLVQYLNQALKDTEPFYFIMIQLTNIPDINNRFGRDVGNLMIAEYIKKMRYHFAKDVNSIFRITGIQFALIIKEQRKYEVLYRALQSGGDLVNLMLNIGGIQQVVYPNLGIVKHEPWSTHTLNELISLGNKALNEAIHNQKKNYSVFGE